MYCESIVLSRCCVVAGGPFEAPLGQECLTAVLSPRAGVTDWMADLEHHKQKDQDVDVILVGNKIDLPCRVCELLPPKFSSCGLCRMCLGDMHVHHELEMHANAEKVLYLWSLQVVTTEAGKKLADSLGVSFFETSALKNKCVIPPLPGHACCELWNSAC